MQRYFARKGDKTTANGDILEGEDTYLHHGIPVAFHGAKVYCPACSSTGVILTVPPFHPFTIHGKQIALSDDLCICKCSPPPKLIASQTSGHMSFGESGGVTTSRAGTIESAGIAVTALASASRALSDDDARMEKAAYGDPRFWTAQVGSAPTGVAATDSPEKNTRAFLRLIRYAEHNKDDDSVYSTMYGGGRFTGFATHPNPKGVTRWGHTSTAAGAYQILNGTWEEAKKHGLVSDFSPESQDVIAREKLRTRGALSYVKAGDIEHAIPLLRDEWTSLPGAKQSTMPMRDARARFDRYVAEEH